MKTNMIEYYKYKYNIDLTKRGDQPLLFVNVRDQTLLLPTSLCHEASLPKDFTND